MRNASTPKLLLYNFTNISEEIKTQSIGKKRRSDTYIVLYIIKKRTCIYILVLSELRRITLLNLENLYIYICIQLLTPTLLILEKEKKDVVNKSTQGRRIYSNFKQSFISPPHNET